MLTRRYALREDQWERIKDLLPGRKGTVGVTAKNNRLFVKPYCTVIEQASLGGTYLNDLAISGWFTPASADEQTEVCGNRYLST
jgi:hypothetical protein